MKLTKQDGKERLFSDRNLAAKFGTGPVSSFVKEELPEDSKPEITEHERQKTLGKAQGSHELTTEEATTVAIMARAGENGQEIADSFGISRDCVSYIKREGTQKVDEAKVDQTLKKVHDLALDRLMNSLGFITTDKLHDLGAKDLSSVASNMSKVHQNLKDNKNDSGAKVTIQIFSPDIKQEKSFKTLDV